MSSITYALINYYYHFNLQDIKPVIDGMDGIKISQGLGLQDFDLIRVIGRGSYAKVLLVRLKKNDQVFAMKVVKKELVHDEEVCRGRWLVFASLIQQSENMLISDAILDSGFSVLSAGYWISESQLGFWHVCLTTS